MDDGLRAGTPTPQVFHRGRCSSVRWTMAWARRTYLFSASSRTLLTPSACAKVSAAVLDRPSAVTGASARPSTLSTSDWSSGAGWMSGCSTIPASRYWLPLNLKDAVRLRAALDVSAGGSRGTAVPSRAGAGGRTRVRGGAAGRWRDAGRRGRDARRRRLALPVGVCAGAGGHVLAVGGDVVGPAGGLGQRLKRDRVCLLSVVGALAGLPGPAQPSLGRPGGVRPNRRRPALTVRRSGVRRLAQVGGGGRAEPVGGRVGARGGRGLVGHRRGLVGQQPAGRGGHSAERQHGHQGGRGRLDRQHLAGHGGPPGERV